MLFSTPIGCRYSMLGSDFVELYYWYITDDTIFSYEQLIGEISQGVEKCLIECIEAGKVVVVLLVYNDYRMNSDEELARKLQEEFDKEAKEILECQTKKDAKFAQIIASGSHSVSDSDTDEENESNISVLKDTHGLNGKDSGKESAVKRPICQYGSKCYRKNPIHQKEYYHPSEESEKQDSFGSDSIKRRKLYSNTSSSSRKKDSRTLVFPDLLNSKLGTLIESVQINFMIDLEFVMEFYKACAPKTPVLFMYGVLEGRARDYEGVTCVKVDMPFQYGVHHSKMMLFHYKEGLRVVVHTANLIPDDWSEKTQGFWVSPLFPPLVYFIASVPGYHTGETRFKYGHLKCRQLLRKYGKWKYNSSTSPVVVQCSSIGTLGKDSKSWLTGELGVSLIGGNDTNSVSLNVVYPSEDDVRKQYTRVWWRFLFTLQLQHSREADMAHCWRSEIRQRTRSMPHIKTYTRVSPDMKKAQYFMLTSSNLSKAAWGQLQKQGMQLFIRSYEAGVLWLPEKQDSDCHFTLSKTSKEENELTLPYDLPLRPYSSDDIPWFMNTNKSIPDILGQTYP
ncbi:Tyrosyl-DNA phosphodiesterase 1 [Armadillidium nasatum]|uniref:Tyrosyl-DNA phosphodiesterase 1 n=1 Tax=Armadillidium nasatum TaxID=96803 RepID=A0A5N5SYC5_9CRUS|nr:Tyrosyl-DNA phosphodiesterase 1 [Armadillidium nasatum]